MKERIDAWNQQFENAAPVDVMAWFVSEYRGSVVFSSSLSVEDQLITYLIAHRRLEISLFTLDTGRLFQETYDLLDITEKKYGIKMAVFFPEASQVEEMVNHKGVNLFYESVENRKLCCHIRKIEPLKRALKGMSVWVTGLRREQSVTRKDLKLVEWDQNHAIVKLNPLLEMTQAELWAHIEINHIPVNPLHHQGYPSIGCYPCTRAIAPGEDVRAGRWWWELPQYKECGLHQ